MAGGRPRISPAGHFLFTGFVRRLASDASGQPIDGELLGPVARPPGTGDPSDVSAMRGRDELDGRRGRGPRETERRERQKRIVLGGETESRRDDRRKELKGARTAIVVVRSGEAMQRCVRRIVELPE